MALHHIVGAGDPATQWRYLNMSRFSVQSYKLFASFDAAIALLATFFCFVMFLRLIVHILVTLSLVPSNDIEGFVSCTMYSACVVSMTLYPLSTNCAMDSNALLPMSGNRWHCLAFIGMCGMSSSAVCVAFMDMLLDNLTIMPGAHCCMFAQCAFMPMKWLSHPELAISCLLFASSQAANTYLDVVLENVIVFVANLCLVVIILLKMYHATGTSANVYVDPLILFADVDSSSCPTFLLQQRALLW